MGQGGLRRLTSAVTVAACVVAASGVSAAATWAGGTTTPRLRQIFAIDATGEASWPYGAEDVLGDGPSFTPAEQAIDIRTAYAATDSSQLWLRVYVADANAVASTATVYVFIDADRNAAVGGGIVAPEIDPALASGSGPGGYDYVVGIRGTGVIADIWQFRTGRYAAIGGGPGNAVGEAGSDTDPILINGAAHGYAQAAVNLRAVAVNATCDTNLYVRSVNNGAGDLDVGQAASCVSIDTNNDGVPDVTVPPGGCTSSAQCPGGGQCVNGTCIVTPPCTTDADCPLVDQCISGRCTARPGGSCTASSMCGDLVCVNGQCGGCTLGGDQCGTGRQCAGSGRCVPSVTVTPGQKVEGGAFHCAFTGSPRTSSTALAVWALGGLGLAFYQRRRRPPKSTR